MSNLCFDRVFPEIDRSLELCVVIILPLLCSTFQRQDNFVFIVNATVFIYVERKKLFLRFT